MDDLDIPIVELVAAANRGDEAAWVEILDRYSPLLVSVIRRFGLGAAQTEDVAATVWLRLVEHLGRIREPQALPKWLIQTARNECLHNQTVNRRTVSQDPLDESWSATAAVDEDLDSGLLRAERHEALLCGLAELPKHQRDVLMLLMHDPQLSYAQISERLGISIGHIGPTRGRAIDALRKTHAISAYMAAESTRGKDGERRDPATLV